MKISMILTSLVVAMSAASLNGCDNDVKPAQKSTDSIEQAPEVVEKAEDLKKEATDPIKPVPPPTE